MSEQKIFRNTIYNICSRISPLIVAVFTIPQIIYGLGIDRFGILTILWMLIGYFSLFDLGLGRALTRLVSEKLGTGTVNDLSSIVYTAIIMMITLGVLAGATISISAEWIVHDMLKVPSAITEETIDTFYILAICMPIVISTTGLTGVLEAYNRFDLVNLVRLPMGLANYVGPMLVLLIYQGLPSVALVLLTIRLVAWLVLLKFSLQIVSFPKSCKQLKISYVIPLIRLGGWMTVSNIISPLMVYMDRFFIGATLSISMVAYYTTPFDVITKLTIVPSALVSVLFPAFASLYLVDQKRVEQIFDNGVKLTLLFMFPITLFIVLFSQHGLNLWLGAQFAQNSTFVLQWLAIGVFVNGLAYIPFSFIQGIGRPDMTSAIHAIEFPLYSITIWFLTMKYGIIGVAIAWFTRVTIDLFLLNYLVTRIVKDIVLIKLRVQVLILIAVLVQFAAMLMVSFTQNILIIAVCYLMVLSLYLILVWFGIMNPLERTRILDKVGNIYSEIRSIAMNLF